MYRVIIPTRRDRRKFSFYVVSDGGIIIAGFISKLEAQAYVAFLHYRG